MMSAQFGLDRHLVAGLDIGNGYVKGLVAGSVTGDSVKDLIDMPSSVSLLTRPNDLPEDDALAADVFAGTSDRYSGDASGDIYNILDVSFDSDLVSNQHRYLFGARSLTADGVFYQFDVRGNKSKAEQELSKILVLGILAAKACKDVVAETGSLPVGDLSASVRLALALPIDEFTQFRGSYAAGFMAEDHTVTLHQFVTPVTVHLHFDDVRVLAEGASAQFAINDKGVPMMEMMLSDLRQRSSDAVRASLADVTAEDVLAAKNTVGIDIGEGTVNFPVFTAGRFNPDASLTFGKGYGSVLDAALASMKARKGPSGFTSRKQLAAYITEEPSPMRRSFYNEVMRFVNEEREFFASEVAEQFGRVLSTIGAVTEVAYVYGGGANAMKEALYPHLTAKVTEMNGQFALPVLYLGSSYSRHLNRQGLFIAANAMERMAQKS